MLQGYNFLHHISIPVDSASLQFDLRNAEAIFEKGLGFYGIFQGVQKRPDREDAVTREERGVQNHDGVPKTEFGQGTENDVFSEGVFTGRFVRTCG
jgi:hypothetical protein